MADTRERRPVVRLVAERDVDAPVLCFMWAAGGEIRVVINARHRVLALEHVVWHLEHGVDVVQLCAKNRACDYRPGAGRQ
jgi:hypothetical protein